MTQNIDDFRWKNRVLLIISDEINSDKIQKQLDILSEFKKGISERKIVTFSATQNYFRENFDEKREKSNYLYKKYVDKLEGFTILLIGLDGGIKLKQNSIITSQKLFTFIDGMPMRKRELKQKK